MLYCFWSAGIPTMQTMKLQTILLVFVTKTNVVNLTYILNSDSKHTPYTSWEVNTKPPLRMKKNRKCRLSLRK